MRYNLLCGMLVLLLAATAAAADSPIDKGSFMLNGSAFIQSQSGELYEGPGDEAVTTVGAGSVAINYFSVEADQTFGIFVSPGVMVGGQLGFQSISQGDDKITYFAVGPTIGYYSKINSSHADVKGTIYAYGGAFFTIGSVDFDFGDAVTATEFGGRAGIVCMLSSAVGADIGAKFQRDTFSDNGESVSGTTVRFGVGISAYIY